MKISIPDFEVPPTLESPHLTSAARERLFAHLQALLQQHHATVIAHYYTDPDIQQLAEMTHGYIGDSLAMAQFAVTASAQTLVVAGVKFMGETAKILNPDKRVVMPSLEATCSLDLGCPIDTFTQFCDAHPERTVVVYCNTSAAVKARADWVVTSSNAIDIIDYLDAAGEKILWAPDRALGNYIQQKTGADMLIWPGSCIVHEEFKAQALRELKKQYPEAAVLVHPESSMAVVELADVVGSTTQLIKASQTLPHQRFIVATDRGIFYKMQQASPDKIFMAAPAAGVGATCRSCAHCPWMAMNQLQNLESSLLGHNNDIVLEEDIIQRAKIPLERMLNFSSK